eukprot:TRINITY_DN11320_c0_g1_i1.p1 TRINITY_DN11320_c0_g1~~TRINITY_DN11320_c0_g1_i1.p1  ORF type:complete len:249 (+),score=-4.05 TRINITY_DN11320_c0_g1_i1:216-962(+)
MQHQLADNANDLNIQNLVISSTVPAPMSLQPSGTLVAIRYIFRFELLRCIVSGGLLIASITMQSPIELPLGFITLLLFITTFFSYQSGKIDLLFSNFPPLLFYTLIKILVTGMDIMVYEWMSNLGSNQFTDLLTYILESVFLMLNIIIALGLILVCLSMARSGRLTLIDVESLEKMPEVDVQVCTGINVLKSMNSTKRGVNFADIRGEYVEKFRHHIRRSRASMCEIEPLNIPIECKVVEIRCEYIES